MDSPKRKHLKNSQNKLFLQRVLLKSACSWNVSGGAGWCEVRGRCIFLCLCGVVVSLSERAGRCFLVLCRYSLFGPVWGGDGIGEIPASNGFINCTSQFGLFVHTILGWFTVVYFGLTVFGDNFGLRSVEVCCAEYIGFVYHCLNYCGFGVRRWCSLLIGLLFGCVRPLVVLITIVLRLNVTAYNKAQKCILKLTKLM